MQLPHRRLQHLTQVSLYNGTTLIGTATFTGVSRSATSTLTTPVVVPANGSVTITVKGDLAAQGYGLASHPGALLTVNVDTNGAAGQGNTLGSGTAGNVNATGSTAVAGVRVFRTFPTVTRYNPASSSLIAQSGVELYRFGVSANASQDVALNQLAINVATSSVSTTNGTTSVTNLKVYAYTGSDFATGPVAGYTAGQVVNTIAGLVNGGTTAAPLSSILTIPKGQTYYFKVVGDITQVAGNTGSAGTVTTKIMGDTAYPSLASTLLDTTTNIGSNNFVWSPMSTTTSAATTNVDWTNGFNVPGIASGNTDAFTLTK